MAVDVEGGALHMVGPDTAGEGDAAAAGVVGDRSVVRVEEGLLDRGGKVGDVVAERVGGGDVGAGSKVGRVRGDEGVKVGGAYAGDDGGAVKVGVVPARGVDEDHVEHRVGQRAPAGGQGGQVGPSGGRGGPGRVVVAAGAGRGCGESGQQRRRPR